MSARAKIPVAELDDQAWAALADAVRRLEEAWQKDGAADLAEFLPRREDSLCEPVLSELVKVDQEYRWVSGEKKLLEAYLEEWPELSAKRDRVAELLEAECLTRAVLGFSATVEEIRSRFPDISDEVDIAAIQAQAHNEGADVRQALMSSPGRDTRTRTLDHTPSATVGAHLLKEGERFGRYEVIGVLGQGGMGTVYRAHDTQLDIDIALKIPRPTADPILLRRFFREAQTVAKVRHRNVCPIYDVGQVEGTHYISMGLVEGRSLSSWLRANGVSPRTAADLVQKLATALAQVHARRIVHRDIKPSNVMIEESGEPVLMDFGLARPIAPDKDITSTDAIVGTIPYMSPEQIDNQGVDFRSDVYSLGVALYQALTGQLPYSGSFTELVAAIVQGEPVGPRTIRPDLDADLEAICLKAMARNPDDRYQAAEELAEALQRYLDGHPQPTERSSARRRRLAAISVAGAAIVLFATVVILLRTGEGTVEIVVNEPNPTVRIDGNVIHIDSEGNISATVGEHEVEISKDGFVPKTTTFTIRHRWDREKVVIELDHPGKVVIELDRPGSVQWLETGEAVPGIALSKDDSTIYAAYGRGERDDSPVQVFQVSPFTRKFTIDFKRGGNLGNLHGDVVLSPDEKYLYTVNYYGRYMSRAELKTRRIQNLDLTADPRYHNLWAGRLGITPDGQKLVVPWGADGRPQDEENDHLSIIDISSGRFSLIAEVPLNDEPLGWNGRTGFSSDNRFAYLATRKRKSKSPTLYEVRLTPPFEVTRTLGLPSQDLRDVAVSGKRNQVFVADRSNRKIWVIDRETFEPVAEMKIEGHAPRTLALDDAAGLLMAVCPASRKLFCLNAADGAVLARVDDLRKEMYDVAFSSDLSQMFVSSGGQEGGIAVIDLRDLLTRIAFASDRDGGSFQIYSMSGGGHQAVRLTDNPFTERFPRWAPDGRKIAFVSDRKGPPKICLIDAEGTLLSVLEDTDPIMDNAVAAPLDWSPDGTQIAFVGGDRATIRVVDVETGKVRTLIEGEIGQGYAYLTSLSWRGADGAILFGSQEPTWGYNHDIFRLDPSTSEVTQLTDDWGKELSTFTPAASPDGKKMAVVRHFARNPAQTEISLLSADGMEPTRLADAGGTLRAAPEWFPDGNTVVYSTGTNDSHRLYAVDIEGGEPRRLTLGDWDDVDPDVCSRFPPSIEIGGKTP